VSGGHGHRLFRPGTSYLHRLPAHTKLVAALTFVLVVVATPRQAYWAFVLYAALQALAAQVAGLGLRHVLRQTVVEVPFVLFAVLLPFLVGGDTVSVGGVELSRAGLSDAWNILAKATLGVWTSVILAGTTSPQAVVSGLQRLRLPRLVVEMLAFMVRYLDVVAHDLQHMRIARASRGFDARGPRHWRVLAQSAGALFIRSYERGERVHLAMLSRGYTGSLPLGGSAAATPRQWAAAAALPAAAAVVAVMAWTSVA